MGKEQFFGWLVGWLVDRTVPRSLGRSLACWLAYLFVPGMAFQNSACAVFKS